MRKLILFLLFLMPLAACKVGPNYHAPKMTVPSTYQNATSNEPASSAAQSNPAEWWTTLEDQTLNSLMDRAVRNNLDLQLAQSRVREARARYGVEKSNLFPGVNASASYQRSRTSENLGNPFTNIVNGNLFQAGFDASWEIDVFGGIRRSIEAANADIASEIENRRDVMVTLLAEVARDYVELRAAQQQAAIAQANLKAQQETLDLTKVRFQAGLVSDLDVARAEALVKTTASELPTLETSAQQSIHLLSTLLGEEPNALVHELAAEAQIPQSPPDVPSILPSDLLRRRPDIRRAERELAAQTARIGVATSDLFPKFSLTAAIGLQSTKAGDLVDSGSKFWSIIPGLSLPIFNFGRIKNNIAVQNAREEQAFITYEQTVLNGLREVEDALVAFSNEQGRRQTLSDAVAANRRAVDLSQQLYGQGLTDFLSVLQAQRDLFNSEDALVQSNRIVTANYVAVYKALGGGWEIEAKVPEHPLPGTAGDRTGNVTGSSPK